jgi:hypothetical protein
MEDEVSVRSICFIYETTTKISIKFGIRIYTNEFNDVLLV